MSLILSKKRPYSGLFLLLLFHSFLLGVDYLPVISSIEIIGNDKTKDYIIDREIQHKINTILDSALAEQDRNRLDNLGLFSEVKWRVIPLENGTAILQYSILESIQKTPPGAFPAYDEKTGWSLAGLWIIQNFRGRNQQISISGSIGARDNYSIGFSDPWMFGNHVSLDLGLGHTVFEHLFLERTVVLTDMRFQFGRWFGEHIKMLIGTELAQKNFFNKLDTISISYLKPKMSVAYDTRDIFWNPSTGYYFSQYFYWISDLKNRENSALIWKQSYSRFIRIGSKLQKLVLAINFTGYRRWGGKNDVWLSYLGGSYSIRGWPLPNRSIYSPSKQPFRFGYEYVFSSIELRKDIIPQFVTTYKFETGLSLVCFIDGGLIADSWSQLSSQKIMAGAGFGIRVPFPMIDVIRLDLGWGIRDGKWNSPSLHWGITQKF